MVRMVMVTTTKLAEACAPPALKHQHTKLAS